MNQNFFHGLPDLTFEDNLIYYKGKQISNAHTETADTLYEKRRAWYIWEMCRYVERVGGDPASIHGDGDFEERFGAGFYREQIARLDKIAQPERTQLCLTFAGLWCEGNLGAISFLLPGEPTFDEIRQSAGYRDIQGGKALRVELSWNTYLYGTGERRQPTPRELALLGLCSHHLYDTGRLTVLPAQRRDYYENAQAAGPVTFYEPRQPEGSNAIFDGEEPMSF